MLNLLLDNKLFLAPIGPHPQVNPCFLAVADLKIVTALQKVIDVGTGTGIWAMYLIYPYIAASAKLRIRDFADQFPSTEVTGTDISPIQPSFVPPNLKFEIDDAQLDWTYPSDHFDFVHLRCLMGSISDWPRLYSQIYRHAYHRYKENAPLTQPGALNPVDGLRT
jgi:SAM-dependent methyltransferase